MLSKNTTKRITVIVLSLSLFALKSSAETAATIELLPGAQVFAQYQDKKPFVANFFTEQSEQEIIDFYQSNYGEITSQTRIKGQLVLKFSSESDNIRIIVSRQSNKHQVDILIN
ncbi:hypothetical protein [Thalassotalea piscium]|uniref:Uncharacterized protein n=1 Tax=Thalassotalea piscium TaxID=1230533 RepID=A0A7X0TSS2_9GAMM|nr:hypothetical protein [Thalassotalea piscium]MBB6542447.1 hypothetical protein [Thalassotalea piscium]